MEPQCGKEGGSCEQSGDKGIILWFGIDTLRLAKMYLWNLFVFY